MTSSIGGATVHLVTILYRSKDDLPGFLESLFAQDLTGWRLHVIDNFSSDGSAKLIAERTDPRVTILTNHTNIGFAKAANQGLREAAAEGGEFFVLINNDTVFKPDFLRRLLAARAELGAGVIAPRIMRLNQPERAWYAGGSLEPGWVFTTRHDEHDPDAIATPRRVDFATGCCLGVSKAVLEKAGLLDERFFVYWEDTDFCMRLNALGVPIWYVPEPSLFHAGGAASGGEFSSSYVRLYYRSYVQLLRKHFGLSYALRTLARVTLREYSRQRVDRLKARSMAGAMLRGLVQPSRTEVRLDRRI